MSVWFIAGFIGFYVFMAVLVGWWWIQQKWSEHQHGTDRCACALYDLTDIEAQHTTVAVHSRDMCAPKREMIP